MDKYLTPSQPLKKISYFLVYFIFLLSAVSSQDDESLLFGVLFYNYSRTLDSNLTTTFNGEVSNNSEENLNMNFIQSYNDVPDDWIFTTCINSNCYNPNIDTISFVLENNSVAYVNIDVIASYMGETSFEIETFEENNPSEVSYSMLQITNILSNHTVSSESKNFQLSYFPNPFNNNLYLQFHSKNFESATVKIYDIEGRLVNIYGDFIISPGTSTFKLNAYNNKGNRIMSGVYYLYVHGLNHRKVLKVSYIK